MKKIPVFALLLGGMFLSGVVLVDGCRSAVAKTYHKNRSHADVPDERIAQGETLAAQYCGSCHMLPSPSLLDAASWETGVLPQMGPRLGIFTYMDKRYPNNSADPHVGRGFYPSAPMMSDESWGMIIDYYTALAPDTLPLADRKTVVASDSLMFKVETPVRADSAVPATCLVRYDSTTRRILTSDIIGHGFSGWDPGLKRVSVSTIDGAIVDLARDSGGLYACNIGTIVPNNALAGHVDRFGEGGAKISAAGGAGHAVVFDGLMRPVNIACGDLNGDGRNDIVVCEFGFIKGALSWLENKGGGKFDKHVLKNMPGAIRVVVQDYNHDGLPDIWVLFAQGDESLVLYTNKGHGEFAEQLLLRWPPSYGSTSFELDDFNHDGFPDVLYTCGDNGDFSTVLKPYHGIYIYMNDGKGHFTQQYFFPMNGCYRAMARDFDGSGNLSIAAIAYFADYARQPEEGFVFLRNKGKLAFSAITVPGTVVGRWMTMDVADMNGDGRLDILLGNCAVGPSFIQPRVDFKKGPPFLLLRNVK